MPKLTNLRVYLRDAQIQFAVEAGHTCHFFYEPNLTKEHFTRAHKLSELEIELTGKRIINCLINIPRHTDHGLPTLFFLGGGGGVGQPNLGVLIPAGCPSVSWDRNNLRGR